MLGNILPPTHILDLWDGSKGHFFKVIMVYIELIGMKQADCMPVYTATAPGCGQKVKTFFRKKVMMHIKLKGKTFRTLYK